MSVLNLKRLSIEELNTLAWNIIDELSTRNIEENSDNFIKEIQKIYDEEYELQEELSSLMLEKEYLDDEIDRIEDLLEKFENKESDLFYKLNIGELHIWKK